MRHLRNLILLSIAGLAPASPAIAQLLNRPPASTPQSKAKPTPAPRVPTRLEVALLRALQSNEITAPYSFATEPVGSKISLRGRVGTRQIHDVAIQTAIALGVPVIDDLLIDTAAAHEAAAYQQARAIYAAAGGAAQGQPQQSQGIGASGFPGGGVYGGLPYTYPPPLFGRLDDPFFGFDPPVIGYPPWWAELSAARLGPEPPQAQPGQPQAQSQVPQQADPNGAAIPYGTIEMTIDGQGTATIRGDVPTLADRIEIGQRLARTQGVTSVVNLINIKPATASQGPVLSDTPPPPPVPAEPGVPPAPAPAPVAAAPQPRANRVIDPNFDPVGDRAMRAVNSRGPLATQPVKIKVKDGVASLSGKVATVYEAMIAYRAVQQTPGVREVEDRLEFTVPDGINPNPLIEKGRPEDVEPYLEAQIRRQIGDLAHVDRVRITGKDLDIRGTLARAEDRDRFDAILRSMPILRGFRVNAELPAGSP